MKTHELKLDIKYFDDVKSGKKNFEIRKNDRDFRVGDILVLKKVGLFEKFLVPIRFAIAVMTGRRQTYLDNNDNPCVESKADIIKVRVKLIISKDMYDNAYKNPMTYVNTILKAMKFKDDEGIEFEQGIRQVLEDYFHTDKLKLPDDYVVLGIEVLE